jgi:hypothetical protein
MNDQLNEQSPKRITQMKATHSQCSKARIQVECPVRRPLPELEAGAFLGTLAMGASAGELDTDPNCRLEIAGLWSAISGSVTAINSAWAGQSTLCGEAA